MNRYNPQIHHRRSIRLKGYDYSQDGLYFVTICCQDKDCRFGRVKNGEMVLNEYGTIAYKEWLKLPERFFNAELDVFQIMPNHIHGIISLNNQTTDNGATARDNRATARVAPTLSTIIGTYKSLVSNSCLKIYNSKNETMGKLWQRNYYENIIRNERGYRFISQYIENNPAEWHYDKWYIE